MLEDVHCDISATPLPRHHPTPPLVIVQSVTIVLGFAKSVALTIISSYDLVSSFFHFTRDHTIQCGEPDLWYDEGGGGGFVRGFLGK